MITPPRDVAVIANGAAGGDCAAILHATVEATKHAGANLRVHDTTGPGDAENTARGLIEDQVDLVIVVGGDGTVREVVSALCRRCEAGSPAPAMLIAPGGTGNSNYRGIWQDRPWERVISAVMLGEAVGRRWLDVAWLREVDRLVLLGAGAGLIAEALRTAQTTGLRGRAGYQRALAETIPRFTPFEGRVSVDGDVLATGPLSLVNVGGGRIRAGSFELLPDSMLDDGLLDVCVLAGSGDPVELAGVAAAGQLRGHPAASFGRGSRVTVERLDGHPLVFEHDGDVAPERLTAFELSVIPAAIAMLVPDPPAASLSPAAQSDSRLPSPQR